MKGGGEVKNKRISGLKGCQQEGGRARAAQIASIMGRITMQCTLSPLIPSHPSASSPAMPCQGPFRDMSCVGVSTEQCTHRRSGKRCVRQAEREREREREREGGRESYICPPPFPGSAPPKDRRVAVLALAAAAAAASMSMGERAHSLLERPRQGTPPGQWAPVAPRFHSTSGLDSEREVLLNLAERDSQQ